MILVGKRAEFDINPWILILVILILGITFVVTVFGETITSITNLEHEDSVLKAHTKAQMVRFFIDDTAKPAMEEALVNFAKNAGLKNTQVCGTLGDFVKWNTQDSQCYKENMYENFYWFAQESMNARFDTFNSWSSVRLEKNAYQWFVDENTIIAISPQKTRIPIISK